MASKPLFPETAVPFTVKVEIAPPPSTELIVITTSFTPSAPPTLLPTTVIVFAAAKFVPVFVNFA